MNDVTTTPNPNGVNAHTLAKMAHVSERHFYKLQAQPDAPPPIAKGRYDADLFLQWYIRRLNAEVERRDGAATDAAEMRAAKLSLMAARAQHVEIHNAVKRGDLVRIDEVTALRSKRLSNLRQRMRAIPTTLGPQLAHKPDLAYIEGRLMEEINHALSELDGSPTGHPQSRRDGRRRRIV